MSIDSYGGETITLAKKGWTVPEQYEFGENKGKLRPLSAGETVAWSPGGYLYIRTYENQIY